MSLTRGLLALGLLAGAAATAEAHGRSQSFAEGRLHDGRFELTVRLEAHDLVPEIAGLDADRDGAVSAAELAAAAPRVGEAIRGGVRLTPAGAADCPVEAPRVQGTGAPVEEVRVDLTVRCPSAFETAHLRVALLDGLDPPHVTMATFSGDGLDGSHVFTVTAPTAVLQVPRPPIGLRDVLPWAAGLFAAVSAGVVAGRFLARPRGP